MQDSQTPSYLTSWVAWRNKYTSPQKEPFNLLKEEMGLDRIPTSVEFKRHSGGECPFCNGRQTVNGHNFGEIYCVCEVLNKIHEKQTFHKDVRTKIEPAYLSDIAYPYEMENMYKTTMSPLVEEVERFIKSPDNWLLISGSYGVGKTHLLRAINTAFYPMALYISARDLEQKTHIFRKEDALDYFYSALIKAPILIIDDIGIEYGGPLVKSVIEKVVDDRYERWPDYPLVVATNLMMDEIPGYLPRATDRLLDESRTKIFRIRTKKSYRKIHPEMRP